MFDLFNRKKHEELNADVAGQMLQNIFDVCEVEPNTVPLDDLQSYSNYRKDRFFLQKVVLVIVMLLFLAIPLMFVAPKITVLEQVTQAPHPAYNLNVDSVLPITSVRASVNGQDVPVYEKQEKVYSIEPDISGTMVVTVKCVNNQYAMQQIEVSTIDRDVPNVVSDETKNGMIYIYLEDEGSGVAWQKIYAKKSDGTEFKPDKYDADAGWIAFKYPKESINIFVPDKSENILQLALTIKK